MKIKLTSCIVLNGAIRQPGTACDVPDRLGRELLARNKATEVAADANVDVSNDTAAANASKQAPAAQNNGGKK